MMGEFRVQTDLSIAGLILGASLLVKFVMLVLLVASVASWALIFVKRRQMVEAKRNLQRFEDEFWSTEDLTALFNRISAGRGELSGTERIFEAGFREFARLRKRGGIDVADVLEGAQRAMKVAVSRELEALESSLPFLATVGSVSPYIGLFGTVWGIMNSFQALGNVCTKRPLPWSPPAFPKRWWRRQWACLQRSRPSLLTTATPATSTAFSSATTTLTRNSCRYCADRFTIRRRPKWIRAAVSVV